MAISIRCSQKTRKEPHFGKENNDALSLKRASQATGKGKASAENLPLYEGFDKNSQVSNAASNSKKKSWSQAEVRVSLSDMD